MAIGEAGPGGRWIGVRSRDWPAPFEVDLPAVSETTAMPRGFRAGAATAGIKTSGRPDLSIVAVDSGAPPAAAAAVFTTNRLPAAPVVLSRRHLGTSRYGRASAVIGTSGCANAATGAEGLADQEALAAALGEALQVPAEATLALSTGLIGTRLPVDSLRPAIATLAGSGLASDDVALLAVADALRTTDSRTKAATVEMSGVRVTGVAKGVGMIHPRMATMLAVVLTDARVEPEALHRMLRRAAVRTWDQITVDGDTSTSDTCYLLASGAADEDVPEADLAAAVEAVARSLARQQAADGEGATTLITCQVSGGADDADARAIARAVISSSLLKAAIHGRDPNWGRIAAAAGNAHLPDAEILEAAGLGTDAVRARAGAPVQIDPSNLRIAIAATPVFAGVPLPFDEAAVRAAMDAPEVVIRIDLGSGNGIGEAFGCDLTEAYVVENSAYST